MTTCALIAAYNEASRIAEVVQGVRPYVGHVIVVDDGSTDDTARVAAAAGAEVLQHQTNQGKGAAIRSGLAVIVARPFSHVLLLDGDMQHAPGDTPRLLAAAQRGDGPGGDEHHEKRDAEHERGDGRDRDQRPHRGRLT